MTRAAALLRQQKRDFAEIITREMGKPVREAVAEVEKCAWVCEFYAEKAADFLKERKVKTEAEKSMVLYLSLIHISEPTRPY